MRPWGRSANSAPLLLFASFANVQRAVFFSGVTTQSSGWKLGSVGARLPCFSCDASALSDFSVTLNTRRPYDANGTPLGLGTMVADPAKWSVSVALPTQLLCRNASLVWVTSVRVVPLSETR